MFLENFFIEDESGIHFTRQQGSTFAKQVAGDFNPLHDETSKRFCVPGDLLFSLVLHKYGISQQMCFTFSGMVDDNKRLCLPNESDHMVIKDSAEKEYLTIQRSGDTNKDPQLIEQLIKRYVEFSGQAFPHILVPLMKEHGVMINTLRPMVIYGSMSINMSSLNISDPSLELSEVDLVVNGKRGKVTLAFNVLDGGDIVGRGSKSMVLSGLREYDQAAIDILVREYSADKEAYQSC
ncbi:hypothetical protein MNBD_GAMMA18-2120 [hydrothermal vent metagenome]|uniref:DUF3581 domain-containing protein n=1 Tax=hydrothermal vent metagenome TaxID=652676 RepID=A0A3B0ZJ21_9ZZZZ